LRSAAVIGAAVLALVIAGCRSDADERTLFVLLTDNRLLRVSEDGELLTRTRLAPAPRGFPSYGGLLAASPDRSTIYALVRGTRQELASVDRDGVVRERHRLPGAVTWRRLAVGPRSGRIFIAGNVAGRRRNEVGDVELSVRLLVLSPRGERLAFERIRRAAGHDWYVNSLTIAEDESSLLVTYHGSDTTGADRVRLDPIRRCRDTTPAWGACLARNHGRAEWIGDRILTATGQPALELLEPSGDVVRKLDTGLQNVHLMEFTPANGAVYAFGNCVQGLGLARVRLAGGRPRTLIERACGDTAALLDDSTLVLGRRQSDDAFGGATEAALLFVDVEARRVEKTVRLATDPADVLAGRPAPPGE
jgi:hypothetical protein